MSRILEQTSFSFQYRKELINELDNHHDRLRDFITPSGDLLVNVERSPIEFIELRIQSGVSWKYEEERWKFIPRLRDQFNLILKWRHREHGIPAPTLESLTEIQKANLVNSITVSTLEELHTGPIFCRHKLVLPHFPRRTDGIFAFLPRDHKNDQNRQVEHFNSQFNDFHSQFNDSSNWPSGDSVYGYAFQI